MAKLNIDYRKLYKLQDKVLDIVFSTEKEFYLTGGTCLNRFYQEKRYSDDLDFFTNSSSRFGFAVKNIKLKLANYFPVTLVAESKDFVKIEVDHFLMVDFVNDRVPRHGDFTLLKNGYIIDTIENILSNKLTAVIGRDNPKDIFDIYMICQYYSIDWDKILISAREKTYFNIDDLLARLKSFPGHLFNQIKIIDPEFLNSFKSDFPKIIEEIRQRQIHNPPNSA